MDDRETFDRVKKHLLSQGKRAEGPQDRASAVAWRDGGVEIRLDPVLGCAYRAPDGCRCAIGCLISDDRYDPSFEGRGLPSIERFERADEVPPTGSQQVLRAIRESGCLANLCLLKELQGVHDGTDPGDWAIELNALELRYFGAPS